jgi:hypothetical protein
VDMMLCQALFHLLDVFRASLGCLAAHASQSD